MLILLTCPAKYLKNFIYMLLLDFNAILLLVAVAVVTIFVAVDVAITITAADVMFEMLF